MIEEEILEPEEEVLPSPKEVLIVGLVSAVALDDAGGQYDCVVSHVELGEIPYLADRNDSSCLDVIALIDESPQLIKAYTPPPPPTAAELLSQAEAGFNAAVEGHIEAIAKERGYDSAMSFRSYAGAVNPYQAEAEAFVKWSGEVWAYCYAELGKVKAGSRSIPEIKDFISELAGFGYE